MPSEYQVFSLLVEHFPHQSESTPPWNVTAQYQPNAGIPYLIAHVSNVPEVTPERIQRRHEQHGEDNQSTTKLRPQLPAKHHQLDDGDGETEKREEPSLALRVMVASVRESHA
jgi:hypothetical protein